jgi:hypothetical protein
VETLGSRALLSHMPSSPPPDSQTLTLSPEASPLQQFGSVPVLVGQKRSATSEVEANGSVTVSASAEPSLHLKTRIIDPIASLLSESSSNNPAHTVLQVAARLAVSYGSRDHASLSVSDWATICEHLAEAVSLSLTPLDFGDDEEQSRQVLRVRKAFSPCALVDNALGITPSSLSTAEPTPPMTSSNDALLSSLRQMQTNFESRLEARFGSRLAQIERRINNNLLPKTQPPTLATSTSPAPITPNQPSSAKHDQSSPTSYAQAAAKSRPAEPVRYVVRYQGHPPSLTSRMHPKAISDSINSRLNNIPTARGLQVLGSHYNTSGNIILTFPPHTPISRIEDHMRSIRDVLGISSSQPVSRDISWSKIVLGGVIARVSEGEEVFSDEVLLEALLRNPQIKNLKITQAPRWVRCPHEITGFKSSVSFAFEDPDGSIRSSLLKSKTPIFMFGAPVTAKRWVNKPRLRQCKRCWRLGHVESGCRSPARCRICGEKHTEEAHREKCSGCINENSLKNIPCTHTAKCVNCSQAHPADDVNCTARKKFSIPATVPLNSSSDSNDMVTDT